MSSTRITWEEYALQLAKTASLRSEDPYLKVGACVLRDDHTVAGLGFNGPPKGLTISFESRDHRRKYIVHAEANALRYCVPGGLSLIAVTHSPCVNCAVMIRAYQIPVVVYGELFRDTDGLQVLEEFGTTIVHLKI